MMPAAGNSSPLINIIKSSVCLNKDILPELTSIFSICVFGG